MPDRMVKMKMRVFKHRFMETYNLVSKEGVRVEASTAAALSTDSSFSVCESVQEVEYEPPENDA